MCRHVAATPLPHDEMLNRVSASTARPLASSETPAQQSTTSSPCKYTATCKPSSRPSAPRLSSTTWTRWFSSICACPVTLSLERRVAEAVAAGDLVDARQHLLGQRDVHGRNGVGQLFGLACADDRRGDGRPAQCPGN